MSKIILILSVTIFAACGPLRIGFKAKSPYNKDELLCCTNSCSEVFEIEGAAMHYQSGRNYIWLSVIQRDTSKNILLKGISSKCFLYSLISSKTEGNIIVYVYENNVKLSYESLINKLKTEELTLEIKINERQCENIKLIPAI